MNFGLFARFGRAATAGALAATIALAGCAAPAERETGAQGGLDAIYAAYPELKGKTAEEAVVKRVVDGDTFETADGEKVRLIGVNTPEKYGKVEYYGIEASAYSEQQLKGRSVYLFQDVSKTDRYGRLLRFVFLQGETEMYNETLLNEGYANVMTVPPDVAFAKKFAKLERAARDANVGLWGKEGSADEAGKAGAGGTETPAASAPACAEPTIKGNITSGGKDKIYHVPGGQSYEQTKPEAMFCTEEEAIAAGFRKASR